MENRKIVQKTSVEESLPVKKRKRLEKKSTRKKRKLSENDDIEIIENKEVIEIVDNSGPKGGRANKRKKKTRKKKRKTSKSRKKEKERSRRRERQDPKTPEPKEKKKRKKSKKYVSWDPSELRVLKLGLGRYKWGDWKYILEKYKHVFDRSRTNLHLRDAARREVRRYELVYQKNKDIIAGKIHFHESGRRLTTQELNKKLLKRSTTEEKRRRYRIYCKGVLKKTMGKKHYDGDGGSIYFGKNDDDMITKRRQTKKRKKKKRKEDDVGDDEYVDVDDEDDEDDDEEEDDESSEELLSEPDFPVSRIPIGSVKSDDSGDETYMQTRSRTKKKKRKPKKKIKKRKGKKKRRKEKEKEKVDNSSGESSDSSSESESEEEIIKKKKRRSSEDLSEDEEGMFQYLDEGGDTGMNFLENDFEKMETQHSSSEDEDEKKIMEHEKEKKVSLKKRFVKDMDKQKTTVPRVETASNRSITTGENEPESVSAIHEVEKVRKKKISKNNQNKDSLVKKEIYESYLLFKEKEYDPEEDEMINYDIFK